MLKGREVDLSEVVDRSARQTDRGSLIWGSRAKEQFKALHLSLSARARM
jgi:hypothetical protein